MQGRAVTLGIALLLLLVFASPAGAYNTYRLTPSTGSGVVHGCTSEDGRSVRLQVSWSDPAEADGRHSNVRQLSYRVISGSFSNPQWGYYGYEAIGSGETITTELRHGTYRLVLGGDPCSVVFFISVGYPDPIYDYPESASADGMTVKFPTPHSYDVEDGTVNHVWYIAKGENAAGPEVGRGADFTYTFPEPGIYTVRAQATDSSGLTNYYDAPIEVPLHPAGGGVAESTCEATPYSGPQRIPRAGGLGWSMSAEVTGDDGLRLREVKLGSRLMARQMSLPYIEYSGENETSFPVSGPVRGVAQLRPKGNQRVSRSRLESFDERHEIASNGTPIVVLEARYVVDRLTFADPARCLHVTQKYEFWGRRPGDHCEPTGKVPCARFRPMVSYSYGGPASGPGSLTRATFPQRFHFVADGDAFNAAALAEDHDDIPGALQKGFDTFKEELVRALLAQLVPGFSPEYSHALYRLGTAPVIKHQRNPVPEEAAATVISQGHDVTGVGRWDNYHQTRSQAVQMPRGMDLEALLRALPSGIFAPAGYLVEAITRYGPQPGCPECVHIHWRWGAITTFFSVLGFEDANEGRPRIPAGSTQDVTIGIVKPGEGGAAAREADPFKDGWRSLVNRGKDGVFVVHPRPRPLKEPEPGMRNGTVFWYEGTGHGQADEFFTHGGFFSYDKPGAPAIGRLRLVEKETGQAKPIPTDKALLRFGLSEWSKLQWEVTRDREGRRSIVAGFEDEGVEGSNDRDLALGLNGEKFEPGRYTIRIRAEDLSGHQSAARSIGLTVK